MLSRSDIPRTEATLAMLGCVAIRHLSSSATEGQKDDDEEAATTERQADGDLVAWAFLGVDSSLTALHVEPAHRRKGLARAVSRRLFEKLARDPISMGFSPVREAEEDGWVCSDVAEDNAESVGVVKGLGGQEGWRVRWIGVDLRRVGSFAERWTHKMECETGSQEGLSVQ